MSDDLAAFLAARLDEDEARHREIHEARVCSGCSDGWEAGFDPERCDCSYPARVLREVQAARGDLEAYLEAAAHPFDLPAGVRDGRDQWERERDGAVPGELEAVIQRRAAVYSDCPGYQQEWKP